MSSFDAPLHALVEKMRLYKGSPNILDLSDELEALLAPRKVGQTDAKPR